MSYHVSDSERGREDIQYDTDELLTVTVHQAMMTHHLMHHAQNILCSQPSWESPAMLVLPLGLRVDTAMQDSFIHSLPIASRTCALVP
jgi:hypothetical protein